MVEQRRLAGIKWMDIVDEDNEVTAQPSRGQTWAQRLCHRAAYIVVHDGTGKIPVQYRTEAKDFLPGMLDIIADGVVQAGEQMLESVRRETEEELGVTGVPFAEHGQFYLEDQNCHIRGGLFSYASHGPFAFQEDEVSKIYWLAPEEVIACCDEFTPNSPKALTLQMTRDVKNEGVKVERQGEAG